MRTLLAAVTTFMLTASLAAVVGSSDPVDAVNLADPADRETYIVTLHDPPLATYAGGIAGIAATAPHATGANRLDPESPASRAYLAYLETQQDAVIAAIQVALGRTVDVGLRYDVVVNGFTAELTAVEASTVAGLPDVARVEPDMMLELHTDAGPAWIGAPAVWDGAGGIDATKGEGVVVGVIDTGVNFRHPAFAEVGPVDGHVHENPRGTYFGLCDPVTGAPYCNDKLIGMWDFATGAQPVDDNGHGSHTASTAAGNELDMSLEAPTITVDRTISGVAPHANIISYKACVVIGSCPLTGTLGSINQAILDQVDVINFSIGGGPANPWTSTLAVAFLNARSAGVFVATSAGNSGPGAGTVGNPANAPWVFSVGASTHDRDFPNRLTDLVRDGAPGPADMSGKGLTAGFGPARVVYAGDFGNALCGDGTAEAPINPFPPGTFDGAIVVCDRGVFARVDKARHVHEAGAGGFVLANDEASGDSLNADPYVLPGVHITFTDGVALKAWIAEGGGADHQGTAVITGMTVDLSPENGDVMAAFSSRGPNAPAPGVLKPDITAPGVDILAAWEGLTSPTDPETYNSISGTSMSSPHAAGSAALVRALEPDWSPDEVRSALMTTAFTEPPGSGDEVQPVLKEDGTPADPFDRGAGRIDLSQAALAGLVLDETPESYQAADPAADGDPRTLNLPSLADPACEVTCTWTRELRATADATWTASAASAEGVTITVEPESFTLAAGETVTLTVTADVSEVTELGWQFGQVRLVPDDGETVPAVHLPVAVQPEGVDAEPEVELLTLHFRGNLDDEFGCTGDGRTDVAACGGPFLVTDGELSAQAPARWGPAATGVNGTAAQNIHDPNWTWVLDEPTTVGGPMTVEWWAGCALCGVLGEDWTIRLWADGELAHEERVTATPQPGQVTLLETTVTVPEVSAAETFTIHVDPVFVDTQQGTFVFYDSTQPCPGASDGACDSVVHMPLPRETETVDLTVTDVVPEEIPGRERRGGPRYRLIATIENLGAADAGPSHTKFWLSGEDRDDLLGLVTTPAIGAGEAGEVEVGFDTRGLNGDYAVTVTADALQALPDSDRANNASQLLTTVRGNQIRDFQFESESG